MRCLVASAILVLGCSGSTTNNGTPDGGADGVASGDAAMTPVCPKTYGTFVVVGDSISDVGSGSMLDKQQPFYRELLVKNDDTLYPDWKGKDFTACWGSANVVKVSKGGAVATEGTTGASVLFDQVKSLPAMLPGPVLVVGTIGGNDVQRALPDVLLGQDVSMQLASFKKGLDDAFGELAKTDRFGAGVKADILLTNIYDPSGGTGNFSFPNMTKCPGVLGLYPANMPTDPLIKPWNDAMTASATAAGVKLLDLQTLFKPHAVSAMDGWFFSDCIHPNTAGHEHIRELFWGAIPR